MNNFARVDLIQNQQQYHLDITLTPQLKFGHEYYLILKTKQQTMIFTKISQGFLKTIQDFDFAKKQALKQIVDTIDHANQKEIKPDKLKLRLEFLIQILNR